MKINASYIKVWAVFAAQAPIFVAGLWVIGIPMKDPMLWLFLGFALGLFTAISALFATAFASTAIDEAGIRCSFPFTGLIAWNQIRAVRRQWPFLSVIGNNGMFKIMPMRWLMKNEQAFDGLVKELEQTHPWARELMEKA